MAAKTIIVPQGLINPNTMTVIEIPAESQHESVFVANITQAQEPVMDGRYLFNMSNMEPPREFRPRFESSPNENRPVRDPTPITMDSSVCRNQMQSLSSGSPGTPIDYDNIWKPENASSSIDFTGSLSEDMSLKMTSETSITGSGQPTRTMVTTTKLINLSSADRPYDYYQPDQSPGWLPRHEGAVHSPENFNNMRYCDAQSSRVDGNRDMYFSGIEDSEAPSSMSGALRTSQFQQLMGAEMRRQMVMPMLSPMERQGYHYDEEGMPIGPSPPKSYYKKAQGGTMDQRIVSTISMDESSGMASSNVSRSPDRSFSPGQQNVTGSGGRSCGGQQNTTRNTHSSGKSHASADSSYNTGEICAGSVCAGGTYCKSAAIMGLTNPEGSPYGTPSPRPKSPQNATRTRSPLNTTRPRATTPQTYNRNTPPGTVAYMQAIPPSAAAGALNATMDVPSSRMNTTRGRSPEFNEAFVQSSAAMNTTCGKPAAGLNTTYQRPAALNTTCDMACSGQVQGRTGPRTRSRSPGTQGAAGPAGITDSVQNALLAAEREERRMIGEDLTRIQMERRELLQSGRADRERIRSNLFGPNYKEDPPKRQPRRQAKNLPICNRPKTPWR